jgi:hypothetical protein
VKKLIGGILDNSEFLKTMRALNRDTKKSRLFGDAVRRLSEDEISLLKAQGNRSADWSLLWVADGFRPDFISDSLFIGVCAIGRFDGKPTAAEGPLLISSGIFKSIISDTEVGDNCLVYGSSIARYCVAGQAVVYRVGALVCGGNCVFGNGRDISVGIETGGREVQSFADMTIPIAQAVATQRGDKQGLAEYKEFVKAYTAAALSSAGYVGAKSVIKSTPRVADTFVGPGCVIDGATLVENCTILCSLDEKAIISHGAFVKNSCIQWGCEVSTMAIVDDSVLTEHSHVERHGKVTQSIIGPNTGIAEGEVTASLIGPFVGFHHQSLLIAAIWPEGKGNVAYGANVGSNHTSKAPDQEIWCGEGTFFGLGVNIKFPADFSCAPYSIIATGVTTLPQRVEFPFCLINKPSAHFENAPPSFNEIFPGWVLSDNIYTVKRNEGKYLKRNKAKRSAFMFDVFRPDIVDMLVTARNRLKNLNARKKQYSSADIAGLGKNVLTEESREKGIATYDFYIAAGCDALVVYKETTKDPVWEHQRGLMEREGYALRSVKENLTRLIWMHEKVAADTQKAKEKDDVRGNSVIADYAMAHAPANEDSFVKETWKKTGVMKAELERIIARL